MGLLYNRALFTKAGLDPDKPPTTWDEVRADAKKIAALGNGTVGYADYSKNNQGGWHFTAGCTRWAATSPARTATSGSPTSTTTRASSPAVPARHALDRQLAWAAKQLLEIPDVQGMMGAGQLGMYMAAPDNVPVLVKQFKGKYDDYGLAAMPGGQGTLLGGEGYMINPKATPEKIKAGLEWIQWKYLNPDRFEQAHPAVRATASSRSACPPSRPRTSGRARSATSSWPLKAKYANVPAQNYQSYVDTTSKIKGSIEPPNAQQIYAVLDSVMQAVLTDQNANVDQLLSSAPTKVNCVLAQVK